MITRRWLLAGLITALALVGCATAADVRPGTGRMLEIRGRTYEEIWTAVVRVANEHFEILERDRARGVIRAERTYHFMEPGEYVGIFITPTSSAAEVYTIEVVSRRKSALQFTGQAWEKKILRDVWDTLAGRPLE